MWKASQAIRDDIKHLEEMLKGRRAALAAVEKSESESQSIDGEHARFINEKEPIKAALKLLDENDGRLLRSDLEAMMVQQGAMHGRSRPGASAQTCITQGLNSGSLIKDGEYILRGTPPGPRVRRKSSSAP